VILNYSGASWAIMRQPFELPNLYGIWGTSASNLFVVGWWGTILEYGGGD
jgi:hypothetical protein